MTENDKPERDEEDSEAAGEDATFDAVDDATVGGDDAGKAKRRAIGLTTIAWPALFLSLISIAGVGYVLLDDAGEDRILDDARTAVDNLRLDIAETNDAIAALRSELADLRDQDATAEAGNARLATDLERLERELDRRRDLLDSLPPRMSSIEQTVAALQGVSLEARNTYLVAEAEYYMQIANAQLQLAGNPLLASLALRQADDRLLQLADPALTAVRRALADEIAALDAMEKPDMAGATLTLGSLSRVVGSLPLRTVDGDEAASGETGDDTEEGGVSRAWSKVKGAFSGLVKVTPPADERAPLLTPEAEPLIIEVQIPRVDIDSVKVGQHATVRLTALNRSNLALMLQAARLALLRGEQVAFEQSLDDADAWLASYFDTGSAQVASARETIAEIRGDYASTTVPDISASLRLLRQYRTLAETPR